MPGYVVLSVEVLDAERYKEYARLGTPTVIQYGGRYLVRGGQVECRSGTWEPKRLVILEFPSVRAGPCVVGIAGVCPGQDPA